jgi:hypothetical protein
MKTYMIFRSIRLRMGSVSEKSCRENQNTHFMFNKFISNDHAVYGIMWKNTVELDRSQKTT